MELENDETISNLLEQLKAHGAFNEIFELCTNDIYSEQIFLNWKQQIEYNVTKYLNRYQFSSELDKNNMQEIIETYLICGPQTKSFENGANRIIRGMTSKMVQYFEPKISFVIDQFFGEKNKHSPIDQNGSNESNKESNNKKDETITVFYPSIGLTSVTKNTACIKRNENIKQTKAIQLCIEPKSLDNQYNNKIKLFEAPNPESLLTYNETRSVVCKIDINPQIMKLCENLKHKSMKGSKNTLESINKFILNLDEKEAKSSHDEVNLNSEDKADMNVNKNELNSNGSLKSPNLELKLNTGEIHKGKIKFNHQNKKTKQNKHKLCENNIIETAPRNKIYEENILKTYYEPNTRIHASEKTLSGPVSYQEIENKCTQALGNALNKLLDDNPRSKFSYRFNEVLDDLFDKNINNHNEIDKLNDLLYNKSNESTEKNHINQVNLNLDQNVVKLFNNEVTSNSKVKADIKLNKNEFDFNGESKSTIDKIKKGKRKSNDQITTSKQKKNKLCKENNIHTELNESEKTLSGTVLYKEVENNCTQTLGNVLSKPLNDNLQAEFSKSKVFPSKFPEVVDDLLSSDDSIEEAEKTIENIKQVNLDLDEKEVKSFNDKVNLNLGVGSKLSLNDTEFDFSGELKKTTLKSNTGRVNKSKRKSNYQNTSKQKKMKLCENNLIYSAPTIQLQKGFSKSKAFPSKFTEVLEDLFDTKISHHNKIDKLEGFISNKSIEEAENFKNISQVSVNLDENKVNSFNDEVNLNSGDNADLSQINTFGNVLCNSLNDNVQAEFSMSKALPHKFDEVLDDLLMSDDSIEECEKPIQNIKQVNFDLVKEVKSLNNEINLNSGDNADLSRINTEFNSNDGLKDSSLNFKSGKIKKGKSKNGHQSKKAKKELNKLGENSLINTATHCESIIELNETEKTLSGQVLYNEIENCTQTFGNVLSDSLNDNVHAEFSNSKALPSKLDEMLDDLLISDDSIEEAEKPIQNIKQVNFDLVEEVTSLNDEINLNSGIKADLNLNNTELNSSDGLKDSSLNFKSGKIKKGKSKNGHQNKKAKKELNNVCESSLIDTATHCESIIELNETEKTLSGQVLYNEIENCTQTFGNVLSDSLNDNVHAEFSNSKALPSKLDEMLDDLLISDDSIEEAEKPIQNIKQVNFDLVEEVTSLNDEINLNSGIKADLNLNNTELNSNDSLKDSTLNLKSGKIKKGKRKNGSRSKKAKKELNKLGENSLINTATNCESITELNKPVETLSGQVLNNEMENCTQTFGNDLSNSLNDNLQAEFSKSKTFPIKFTDVYVNLIPYKPIQKAEKTIENINQIDLNLDEEVKSLNNEMNLNPGTKADLNLNNTEPNSNDGLKDSTLNLKSGKIKKGKRKNESRSKKAKKELNKLGENSLINTATNCESITELNKPVETLSGQVLNNETENCTQTFGNDLSTSLNDNLQAEFSKSKTFPIKFTDVYVNLIPYKPIQKSEKTFENINQIDLNLDEEVKSLNNEMNLNPGTKADLNLNNTEPNSNDGLKDSTLNLKSGKIKKGKRKNGSRSKKAKKELNKLGENSLINTATNCESITELNKPVETLSGQVLNNETENCTQTFGNDLSTSLNDNLQAEFSKSKTFPIKFTDVYVNLIPYKPIQKSEKTFEIINQIDLNLDEEVNSLNDEMNLNSGIEADLNLNNTEPNSNDGLKDSTLNLKSGKIKKGKRKNGSRSKKAKKELNKLEENSLINTATNCESITELNKPVETLSGQVLNNEMENCTQTFGNDLSNSLNDNLQAEFSKSKTFPIKFTDVYVNLIPYKPIQKTEKTIENINQIDLNLDEEVNSLNDEMNLNSGIKADLNLNNTEPNSNDGLKDSTLNLKSGKIKKGKRKNGSRSKKAKKELNKLGENSLINTATNCESITELNKPVETLSGQVLNNEMENCTQTFGNDLSNSLNDNLQAEFSKSKTFPIKFTDVYVNLIPYKPIQKAEKTIESINQIDLNLDEEVKSLNNKMNLNPGTKADLNLNNTEPNSNDGLKDSTLNLKSGKIKKGKRKNGSRSKKAKKELNKLGENSLINTATNCESITELNKPVETLSGQVLNNETENCTQTFGNDLSTSLNDNLQAEFSKSKTFPIKFTDVYVNLIPYKPIQKSEKTFENINQIDLNLDEEVNSLNDEMNLNLNNTEPNSNDGLKDSTLNLKSGKIKKGKRKNGSRSKKAKKELNKLGENSLINTATNCESITELNKPVETLSGQVLNNETENCTQTFGNDLSTSLNDNLQAEFSKSKTFPIKFTDVYVNLIPYKPIQKSEKTFENINQIDLNLDEEINSLNDEMNLNLNNTELNSNDGLKDSTLNLKSGKIKKGKRKNGSRSKKAKKELNKLGENSLINTATNCESITELNKPVETLSGQVLNNETENCTQTFGNDLSTSLNDNLQAEFSKSKTFPIKFTDVYVNLIPYKPIQKAEKTIENINQIDLNLDEEVKSLNNEMNLNPGTKADLNLNNTEPNSNDGFKDSTLILKSGQIKKGKRKNGSRSKKAKKKLNKLGESRLFDSATHCESITELNKPAETLSGQVLYNEMENCTQTFPIKFTDVYDDLVPNKSIEKAEKTIEQVNINLDEEVKSFNDEINFNSDVKADLSLNHTEFNCKRGSKCQTLKSKWNTSGICGVRRSIRQINKAKQKFNKLCDDHIINTTPTNISEQNLQELYLESNTKLNEPKESLSGPILDSELGNVLSKPLNDNLQAEFSKSNAFPSKFNDVLDDLLICDDSIEETEKTIDNINQVNFNLDENEVKSFNDEINLTSGGKAESKLNNTEFDCNEGLKSQTSKSKLNIGGINIVRRSSRQINKSKQKINKLCEDNIMDTVLNKPLNNELQAGSLNSRAFPCINKETDNQIVDSISEKTAYSAKLRDGSFSMQGKKYKKVFKGFPKKDVVAKCKQLNYTIQQLEQVLKKLNTTN